jgi:hypothetical protein
MTFEDRVKLVTEIADDLRLEIESDRRQLARELDKLDPFALTALARRLYPSQREPVKVICIRCAKTERDELAAAVKAAKPKRKKKSERGS